MKNGCRIMIFVLLMVIGVETATAQCSICTKTAQQLGEKPAKALNGGIIYLALMPLAIIGFITWQWWKHNQSAKKA